MAILACSTSGTKQTLDQLLHGTVVIVQMCRKEQSTSTVLHPARTHAAQILVVEGYQPITAHLHRGLTMYRLRRRLRLLLFSHHQLDITICSHLRRQDLILLLLATIVGAHRLRPHRTTTLPTTTGMCLCRQFRNMMIHSGATGTDIYGRVEAVAVLFVDVVS